jgi:sulfur-carrier protein adenylyltransferase/sulfurtransferase
VGRLGIADGDAVEHSNLHRQVVHSTADVGRPKVESAREAVLEINPNVVVDAYDARLTAAHAMKVVETYDLVVDASDNFPTRYLTNDACVLLGKPNIYGSIFRFEGQASVFDAKRGPCYRCLYPEPPPAELVPDCRQAGVLGVLPGIVGLIQATEAIKLILGKGEPLIGRLLLFNALTMQFREMRLGKDPNCAICGNKPSIPQPADCQPACEPSRDLTVRELKARLDRGDRIVLLDVREPREFQAGHLPGAMPIPLGELAKRLGELDRESEIVAYCRSGGRSGRAASLLRAAGFRRVHNLSGGAIAWSEEVGGAGTSNIQR